MALRLISHVLSSRGGFRGLSIILKYRKLREKWDSSISVDEEKLYRAVGDDIGVSNSRVHSVIQEWMFERPMDVVKECRDEKLVRLIARLSGEGKKVCIYSDYPTEDKCRAVGLSESVPQYYCGKGEIRTLKPNPSALFYIMNEYPDIPKSRVLMVGDRADRDKACADNAGIDSLILGKYRILR